MTWIQTYTGRKFCLDEPSPRQVCLGDIAHALALQCRFNGHVREFYSVAQHSALVAQHVQGLNVMIAVGEKRRNRYTALALLHDAHEAYTGDIVAPLKALLSDVRGIEAVIQDAIHRHFGLTVDADIAQVIKHADLQAVATEARDLMSPLTEVWEELPLPWPDRVVPLAAEEAESQFLELAESIGLCGNREDET